MGVVVAGLLPSLLLLLLSPLALAQDPTPPTSFPSTFFSWMVVSVTVPGVDKPLLSEGQMIAFDQKAMYSSRYIEQNLLNATIFRPNDYCDGAAKMHYRVIDATGANNTQPPCNLSIPLTDPFLPPAIPKDFLNTYSYLGKVKVNQEDCNHFYSDAVYVEDIQFQMDLFTDDNGFPCQISIQNKVSQAIYTWAFDGFNNVIPGGKPLDIALLMCGERDWTCQASPTATPSALQSALGWVCGVQDCSPINPGGAHYIPNTLVDHCNWAFNQYYLANRIQQGGSACNFGGSAVIAPPKTRSVPQREVSYRSAGHRVPTRNPVPRWVTDDPLPFPLYMICQ